MKKIWLITNSNSGSYEAAMCDRIGEAIVAQGSMLDRTLTLPDDDLPGVEDVAAAGVDMVAIFTGDGTINTATEKLEGWDGAVLILPGGTMNLLSRTLHGDEDVLTIVARALSADARITSVPLISGCGQRALAGILAGPTSAWVDVREDMRSFNLKGLTETVPGAITETFNGAMVRLKGARESYPAIYVQPVEGGLEAIGIKAQNAGDLLQHGIAWLSGDFRKGPAEALYVGPEVTVECDGAIGLLVDGEKVAGTQPCTFVRADSALRFMATVPATA